MLIARRTARSSRHGSGLPAAAVSAMTVNVILEQINLYPAIATLSMYLSTQRL
jgi:hypothetical protein